MKSRLWLRFLLLSMGAVACCTHVLAVSSPSWHTGSGGAELFAWGAIGLPVLLLLNERLASWQRGGQFVVGPGLLAGMTIPNMLLSICLSVMAINEAFAPGGARMGYNGIHHPSVILDHCPAHYRSDRRDRGFVSPPFLSW